MIYYATLKTDGTLLITINSFGCVIEAVYISLYLAYAPKKALVSTFQYIIKSLFIYLCIDNYSATYKLLIRYVKRAALTHDLKLIAGFYAETSNAAEFCGIFGDSCCRSLLGKAIKTTSSAWRDKSSPFLECVHSTFKHYGMTHAFLNNTNV